MIHRLLAASLGVCLFAAAACADTPVQVSPAEPVPFAPDTITAPDGVDCLTFMPDGNTVFFDREVKGGISIMQSRRIHGSWSTPQPASFSGTWMDHDPAVSPDGSYLVFTSNRPDVSGGQPFHGGHLWRVDRRGDGWAAPVRFPDAVNSTRYTFAPAVASNGDVYYQQASPVVHEFHLYRTRYRDGSYLAPEAVALGDAQAHQLDPAIAPDGSFIVFDANYAGKDQPDRLYIAFREGDHWSRPIDMGDALNRFQPWGSHLGPDHRTLYFTSDHPLPGTVQTASATRGINHIWSIPLTSWLDASTARSASVDAGTPFTVTENHR